MQSLSHANPFAMTYNSPPILLLFFLLTRKIVNYFLKSKTETVKDSNLEEGLSSYQDAIELGDKQQMLASEDYYLKRYQVKYYSQETMSKIEDSLKREQDLEFIFQDCASYRVLDNIEYAQAFQYEPPIKLLDGRIARSDHIKVCTDYDEGAEEQENDAINQLDATYLAVNFAYCPESVQRKLNFDTSQGQ